VTDEALRAGAWRPLPEPSWLTAPFWDAAAQGRVRIQCCDDCETYVFRPEAFCTSCFSASLTWTDVSGHGVIHSFSVVRRGAYPELPPVYAVVSIAMAEGWFMMSNLIDANVSDVKIDLPVRISHVPFGQLYLPFVVPRVVRSDRPYARPASDELGGAR
jgi:uncharacterized protein